jgi:putative NADH-flavin reductase
MKLLITGATGKVGSNLIRRLSLSPRPDLIIRALCHNRTLPAAPGLEVVKGTISDRDSVERAMDGVSHIVHLATCKELPELVMDVTVKGLFWLTEAFRASATAKQFILIGGDASVGHFFYDHGSPVTEATPHRAYPGCYALSKVLEETLLQQTHIQYGLNVSCLRAPSIMEKDDFRYSLSFGDDVFGGPDWKTLAPRCRRTLPESGDHSPLARRARAPAQAQLRPRRRPRRRHPGRARQSGDEGQALQHRDGRARRLCRRRRLSQGDAGLGIDRHTQRLSFQLARQYAPSSTSTGARAPISPSSSTPPGLFSAPPTIHGRFGIPADGQGERAIRGFPWNVPISAWKPFYEGWISLDSLVRIE